MTDVFVSYNGLDRPIVARICNELVKRGLTPFFDTWDLIPGRRWQGGLISALDQYKSAMICFGPKGLGNWQRLEQEIALDRHAREGDGFPVIPVLLPGVDLSNTPLGFLQLNTWVDLRNEAASDYDALAAAIRGEKLGLNERLRADTLASINPYRGLAYFREEDAPFFHGREDFATSVYEAVCASSFVALVGASGSGKSSIAHAGLLPRLRDPRQGRVWSILTMSPGSDPAERLAEILTPALNPHLDLTSSQFDAELVGIRRRLVAAARDEKGALGRLVRQLCNTNRGIDRVLILIDQFEEVFTLQTPDKRDDTARFLEELVLAARNPEAPVTIVVTMRADQYPHVTDLRDLANLFESNQKLIGAMTEPELRRAIEQPAQKLGARFEEGLVNRILAEVGSEAGALPLLEYALDALWKNRDPLSGALTHKAYDEQGGVRRAIAERANEVYGRLTRDQQAAAREVLLRLVRPGEGVLDSKRAADLGEVGEATRAAIAELARERLIVVGEHNIEITHEALIREWDLLRGWVNEARDDLALRDRLEGDAARWAQLAATQPTAAATLLLPPGLRLEEGRRLIEKNATLLEGFPAVRRYIASSIAADEERTRRERARHEAELGRSRRQNRKLAAAAAIAAVLFLLATGVGIGLFRTSSRLQQAEAQAVTERDTAQKAEKSAREAYDLAIDSADRFLTGIATRFRDSAALPTAETERILADGEAFLSDMAARVGESRKLADATNQLLLAFARASLSGNVEQAGLRAKKVRERIEALGPAETLSAPDLLRLSEAYDIESRRLFEQRDYAGTRSAGETALAHAQAARDKGFEPVKSAIASASGHVAIARALWKLDEPGKAEGAASDCLAVLVSHPDTERDLLQARSSCYRMRALAREKLNKPDEAAADYTDEAQLLDGLMAHDQLNIGLRLRRLEIEGNRSVLSEKKGHRQLMLTDLQRALDIAEKTLHIAPWDVQIKSRVAFYAYWVAIELGKDNRVGGKDERNIQAIGLLKRSRDIRRELVAHDPGNRQWAVDYETVLVDLRNVLLNAGANKTASRWTDDFYDTARGVYEVQKRRSGDAAANTDMFFELLDSNLRLAEAERAVGRFRDAMHRFKEVAVAADAGLARGETDARYAYWSSWARTSSMSSAIGDSKLDTTERINLYNEIYDLDQIYLEKNPRDWLVATSMGAVSEELSRNYLASGDRARALFFMRKAAEMNSEKAVKALEEWYRSGSGPVAIDRDAAEKYRLWLSSRNWSMKRFTVPSFWWGSATTHPFEVYLIDPLNQDHDPVEEEIYRVEVILGVRLPDDVKDSFRKLLKIAKDNKVSFVDLTVYALGTAANTSGSDRIGGRFKQGGRFIEPRSAVVILKEERTKANADVLYEALKRIAADRQRTSDGRTFLQELAVTLRKEGEADLAAQVLSALLDQDKTAALPTQAYLLRTRALALIDSGDTSGARRDLLKAVALTPGDAEALNTLGYLWLEQDEEMNAAVSFIERAAKLSPADAHIKDSLGWAYVKTQRVEEGVALLREAAKELPELAEPYAHLADGLRRLDRRDEALAALDEADRRRPDAKLKAFIDRQRQLLKGS